jgi:hypothetical protein
MLAKTKQIIKLIFTFLIISFIIQSCNERKDYNTSYSDTSNNYDQMCYNQKEECIDYVKDHMPEIIDNLIEIEKNKPGYNGREK